MNAFTPPDDETLLSGRVDWVDAAGVARLVAHPLSGVDTEYPHATGAVDGPGDVPPPSEQHPVFYGCFDWHSAVHSHWALVRTLRLFDDHPERDRIVAGIDARLTLENVAREVAFFDDHETFERPYGWAWLFALAAELDRWDDERADEWSATLRPLETRIRSLLARRFLGFERPFRVGTHGNTAFALSLVLDYTRTVGDDDLAATVTETTVDYYGDDTDAPVGYEPLGWDFISPTLTEADLLRRVLPTDEFASWFAAFLPDLGALPDPVAVDDGESGVALHLIGLNLSRAWCLAGVADALPGGERTETVRASAVDHARRGLGAAFTDDYAGSHWLSSFALYLLTRNEGGIGVEA
ncbi:DUF2891 domain-containing protein [Halobaculum marinum]|uniref:DUF2891 domain-containing protein n=1 Tax=Halobaculum marinum TaxID=3031996 RepID=A0ABD5WZ54_9EURY|nr:DUF2891 domain-containing protein [Halobaculum sp. DT55]